MPGTPLSSRDRDEIAHALIEDREVSWAEIGLWVPETVSWLVRLQFGIR
jgi:hypothetical protein